MLRSFMRAIRACIVALRRQACWRHLTSCHSLFPKTRRNLPFAFASITVFPVLPVLTALLFLLPMLGSLQLGHHPSDPCTNQRVFQI
jgi:hypothetical protein